LPAQPAPVAVTTARTPNRWRRFTLAAFAICSLAIVATSVAFSADPAPGGWINNFERTATTDTFEVQLNATPKVLEVATLNGTPCTIVAGGVRKFSMACPTQPGQKWSLAITDEAGAVHRSVWNRDRFWILPLLIGAFLVAAASAIATTVFALLGYASRRPPKPAA
jgi:hypothetical protein